MRLDLFFSTYICIWCFLYKLKITYYNPFIWLIIAILASIYILFYFHNNDFNYTYYTIIGFIIKIPLLFILNITNIFEGFIFGFLLFILYLIYIYKINNKNLQDIYYDNIMNYIYL